MSILSSRVPARAAAALSLAAIIGMAASLPTIGLGQTKDKDKDKPAPAPDNSTRPQATVEKKVIQPVGNPLQIPPDGTRGDGAAKGQLSREFGDYRHLEGGPPKAVSKPLPLFGYDIFRKARELNDAQQNMISRQAVSEFRGGDPARRRRGSDATTGDSVSRVDGNHSSGQGTDKRTDSGGAPDPTDPRSISRAAAAESSVTSRTDSRTQPVQPSDRSSQAAQDGAYDEAATARSTRTRDMSEPDVQDAFGTPVGPISLLYRAINASIPDNYTLSGGDVLRIRVQSPTFEQQTYKKTVDARGQIQLDPIGSVVVRGQTIGSAEKLIESRLRPYIKNVQVSIETGQLRTMPILVTGAAYVPGTYTVPATATAFNLLNIAGGPSDEGSLRAIEVRRQGKKIATLDIYKMIDGDAQWSDVQLAAGDTIIVPPRKSRVTISGEVLRPAIFELLPTETLRNALAYAGGIKATGLNQSVRVNTVVPGAERVIKDLNVTGSLVERQTLFDGDEVEVFSVRNRLSNRVTIEGAVDQPNDYQLQPGMHVADLVERARGPLSEAFLGKAELHRWQADGTDSLVIVDLEKALARDPKNNLELQKWDRLKVYTREEVAWTGRRTVEVNGAVKKPGKYDVSKNMRVSDLLRMAGGPTPDAELEKAHLLHHHDDGPYTHEYVNIASATKGDTNSDPLVMDSDKLVLYAVEMASFVPNHVVDIKGEVVNEGRYPRFAGMKISDLLTLAGGFRPSASSQVVLAHARRVADPGTTKLVTVNFDKSGRCAEADDAVLEDGDVVSIQGLGGFQPDVQSFKVVGAVNRPGTIFLTKKDMRLSDAIREAGGLRPEAFPDGAEFSRDPQMLATTGQRNLIQTLSSLNDLLNDSETNRERAKAQIELIKALGAAVTDSTGLGALAGGGAAAIPNPAASGLGGSFNGFNLVSPARKLGGSQLDPNRLVAIDLRSAMAKPRSNADIILVNGDEIIVPETPTTVTIIGAVNSQRAVLFEPGKNLDYYLQLAGGFAPDAAKERIVIFHMGGGVIPATHARELKPGDMVLVPTKVLAAKFGNKGNGIDTFFKSLTSSAIVFRLATSIFGF